MLAHLAREVLEHAAQCRQGDDEGKRGAGCAHDERPARAPTAQVHALQDEQGGQRQQEKVDEKAQGEEFAGFGGVGPHDVAQHVRVKVDAVLPRIVAGDGRDQDQRTEQGFGAPAVKQWCEQDEVQRSERDADGEDVGDGSVLRATSGKQRTPERGVEHEREVQAHAQQQGFG